MEFAAPFVITNVVVLKRDVIAMREAQRTDELVVGPSKTCLKQHTPKAIFKMRITTAMIHHVTTDLESEKVLT